MKIKVCVVTRLLQLLAVLLDIAPSRVSSTRLIDLFATDEYLIGTLGII